MFYLIFCNSCFTVRKKNLPGRFFLTQCDHVFCETCAQRVVSTKHCVVCRKLCRVVELKVETNPAMRRLFMNPVQDTEERYNDLKDVLNFQRMVDRRMETESEKEMKKVQNLRKYVDKLAKERQQRESEFEMARKETGLPVRGMNHPQQYLGSIDRTPLIDQSNRPIMNRSIRNMNQSFQSTHQSSQNVVRPAQNVHRSFQNTVRPTKEVERPIQNSIHPMKNVDRHGGRHGSYVRILRN